MKRDGKREEQDGGVARIAGAGRTVGRLGDPVFKCEIEGL